MTIDLNCDMGELPDATLEESLMGHITSANIACGGHAGDAITMERTTRLALRYRVVIGAHPGYPDRANFGRVELPMASDVIEQSVFDQIQALAEVAAQLGAEIVHVKPHGALYNVAVKNAEVAQAIARGVRRWSTQAILIGLAGSPMLGIWRNLGFRIAAEAFADRTYEPDGTLRPRKFSDALITDPKRAALQALSIVQEKKVIARDGSEVPIEAQTICLHSDTTGSIHNALAVAQHLRSAGIAIAPIRRPG